MTHDMHQALAWARQQHKTGSTEWRGLCLMFVRSCYDVPPLFRSAAAAWQGAALQHRETDGTKVPCGVPFFWTGGSQGFGHGVLYAGGGKCWSNDINVSGGISLVAINDITRRWRQTPQGWTGDINKVQVWTPPQPPKIGLSDLLRAFEMDPGREQGGTTPKAKADVLRFERAVEEGLPGRAVHRRLVRDPDRGGDAPLAARPGSRR